MRRFTRTCCLIHLVLAIYLTLSSFDIPLSKGRSSHSVSVRSTVQNIARRSTGSSSSETGHSSSSTGFTDYSEESSSSSQEWPENPVIHLDRFNLPAPDDARFAGRSPTWRLNFDRGVRLSNELLDAQRHLRHDPCPRIRPTWTIEKLPSEEAPDVLAGYCTSYGLFQGVDHIFADVREDGWEEICAPEGYVGLKQETTRGVPPGVSTTFHYENWYSAASRIIIATVNRGRIAPSSFVYRDWGVRPPTIDGPVSEWPVAPNRWEELVFASWNTVCSHYGSLPSTLKFIARTSIINEMVSDVTWDVLKHDNRVRRTSDFWRLYYTTADPDFYAFLGTPNGVGVARLLTRYANQFAARRRDDDPDAVTSVKYIGSVIMEFYPRKDQLELLFTLVDDVPPPGYDASDNPAPLAVPHAFDDHSPPPPPQEPFPTGPSTPPK